MNLLLKMKKILEQRLFNDGNRKTLKNQCDIQLKVNPKRTMFSLIEIFRRLVRFLRKNRLPQRTVQEILNRNFQAASQDIHQPTFLRKICSWATF